MNEEKSYKLEPCDEVNACRVRNDSPDLSYREWVETYCGACPDCKYVEEE